MSRLHALLLLVAVVVNLIAVQAQTLTAPAPYGCTYMTHRFNTQRRFNLIMNQYVNIPVYGCKNGVSRFEINRTLPPGLTFSTVTGAITGTPTAVWPPQAAYGDDNVNADATCKKYGEGNLCPLANSTYKVTDFSVNAVGLVVGNTPGVDGNIFDIRIRVSKASAPNLCTFTKKSRDDINMRFYYKGINVPAETNALTCDGAVAGGYVIEPDLPGMTLTEQGAIQGAPSTSDNFDTSPNWNYQSNENGNTVNMGGKSYRIIPKNSAGERGVAIMVWIQFRNQPVIPCSTTGGFVCPSSTFPLTEMVNNRSDAWSTSAITKKIFGNSQVQWIATSGSSVEGAISNPIPPPAPPSTAATTDQIIAYMSAESDSDTGTTGTLPGGYTDQMMRDAYYSLLTTSFSTLSETQQNSVLAINTALANLEASAVEQQANSFTAAPAGQPQLTLYSTPEDTCAQGDILCVQGPSWKKYIRTGDGAR